MNRSSLFAAVSISGLALALPGLKDASLFAVPSAFAQAANQGFTATFDKVARAKQRVGEIKTELSSYEKNLTNAKAVIDYVDVVTRDFESFRTGVGAFGPLCNERRIDHQKLTAQNSPLAGKILIALKRCDDDTPFFEQAIVEIDRQVSIIKSDIAQIKHEVDILKRQTISSNLELKLHQDLINLSNTIGIAKEKAETYHIQSAQ